LLLTGKNSLSWTSTHVRFLNTAISFQHVQHLRNRHLRSRGCHKRLPHSQGEGFIADKGKGFIANKGEGLFRCGRPNFCCKNLIFENYGVSARTGRNGVITPVRIFCGQRGVRSFFTISCGRLL